MGSPERRDYAAQLRSVVRQRCAGKCFVTRQFTTLENRTAAYQRSDEIMRLAIVAACALASAGAHGQNYPSRAVRIVVPYAAGGNTDFTARVIATKLTDVFGQQVVVENRAGGATNIGSDLVAKAAPDGYTILMGGASNAINMSLYQKLP